MQVFVSEYLCSGAWGNESLPDSLLREGRAMLAAIVDDFARIDDWRVVTTWDRRLGPSDFGGRIEVLEIASPQEERAAFQRLTVESDATFVIAPEFDGLLAERCRLVGSSGGKMVGPSCEAIELCADKLELAGHLLTHDIPTIPSRLLSDAAVDSSIVYPAVIKPRDGAGSQDVYLVRDVDDARRSNERFGSPPSAIVQPWIDGEALSVSAIVSLDGRVEVFPAGVQELSDDGRFRYLGGRIPTDAVDQRRVDELIRRVCASIPGLRGYVGFDVIQTRTSPQRLLIVEINPRLTTSYLGYRRLTDANLAERMLLPEHMPSPIAWKTHTIAFDPDGTSSGLSD